jgi:hypothetical protein
MPTRERSLEQIGLGIMHRLTIDKIWPFWNWLKCVDGFDQRGFAGPDGPHHHHFAFFDVGRAVVEHLHGADLDTSFI